MYLLRISDVNIFLSYIFVLDVLYRKFSGLSLLIETTCKLLLYSQLNKDEFCIDSKKTQKKKETPV